MATKEQMCGFAESFRNVKLYVGKDQKKAPKHIRCPKCGRRLKPRLYNSAYTNTLFEYDDCWWWRVPPHKVKRWWKKKKPLSTKKRER